MWVAKLRIRHDCIIGNRCREFGITEIGLPFNVFSEKGVTYIPQIQNLQGKQDAVDKYIKDIQKDKRVSHVEVAGNTVFLVEVRKDKTPAAFYHNKIIFTKPIFTDTQGYEYWEIASWKKSILTEFIVNIQKAINEVKIEKIEETSLDDIYFSRLQPKLTTHQKRALHLAYEYGYYSWPKKTTLGKLAKMMKVSVATFREHLKKAEQKLLPELIKSVK